jgi:hypothetical protein
MVGIVLLYIVNNMVQLTREKFFVIQQQADTDKKLLIQIINEYICIYTTIAHL